MERADQTIGTILIDLRVSKSEGNISPSFSTCPSCRFEVQGELSSAGFRRSESRGMTEFRLHIKKPKPVWTTIYVVRYSLEIFQQLIQIHTYSPVTNISDKKEQYHGHQMAKQDLHPRHPRSSSRERQSCRPPPRLAPNRRSIHRTNALPLQAPHSMGTRPTRPRRLSTFPLQLRHFNHQPPAPLSHQHSSIHTLPPRRPRRRRMDRLRLGRTIPFLPQNPHGPRLSNPGFAA